VADDRSVEGVPESEQVSIANACHDVLEPPWQPEVITIPVPDSQPTKFVLVLRVDPERAPRPILVNGAAPIRLPGRVAIAPRDQLRQLFSEASTPSLSQAGRLVRPPQLLLGSDGEPMVEFILRSGIVVPISAAAWWRPISEAGASRLSDAFKESQLGTPLLRQWLVPSGGGSQTPFYRKGLNRARHLRLVSSLVDHAGSPALEVVASLDLPSPQTPIDSRLHLTVDLNVTPQQGPSGKRRIDVDGLHSLVDALLQSLTDTAVVEAVADLAGIEPEVVPQPVNVEFVSGRNVDDLLEQGSLRLIPDAGNSRGASLLVDPGNDLRTPAERVRQVDDFLREIAMDAGLEGMESRIADLIKQRRQR
jgi:hypothetical protein